MLEKRKAELKPGFAIEDSSSAETLKCQASSHPLTADVIRGCRLGSAKQYSMVQDRPHGLMCLTLPSRRMSLKALSSLVREKLSATVRLGCFYLFFTVVAADPTGSLPFPSLNVGSGLINLAALTALVGSSTVESLMLGSLGTAGLPWAAMSSFGVISLIKASVTGLSPGWLRQTLGVRNALSDSFLGMSLDLRRNVRWEARTRMNIEQAVGVSCKRTVVGWRVSGWRTGL